VVIYDQEYFVRGDLDEEYIQKLGKYLDDKMRAIVGRRDGDSLRVAVLAGAPCPLNEYHNEGEVNEQTSRMSTRKVGECSRNTRTGS